MRFLVELVNFIHMTFFHCIHVFEEAWKTKNDTKAVFDLVSDQLDTVSDVKVDISLSWLICNFVVLVFLSIKELHLVVILRSRQLEALVTCGHIHFIIIYWVFLFVNLVFLIICNQLLQLIINQTLEFRIKLTSHSLVWFRFFKIVKWLLLFDNMINQLLKLRYSQAVFELVCHLEIGFFYSLLNIIDYHNVGWFVILEW